MYYLNYIGSFVKEFLPLVSILFFLLPFYKIRLQDNHGVLIQHSNSRSINGVFVLLVFISHFLSYNIEHNVLDYKILNFIRKLFAQLMVVSFFVFSGYGIQTNLMKNKNYVQSRFTQRIITVYFSFFIAIIIYLSYGLMSGDHYQLSEIFLSLIAWRSIGNSAWFMFITFVNYLIIFLFYRDYDDKNFHKYLLIHVIILLMLSFFILKYKPGKYFWVDTIFTFPIGMFLKHHENRMVGSMRNIKLLLFSIISLLFLRFFMDYHWLLHNLSSFFFILIVFIFNSYLSIENRILLFFSKYTFEIYIYQRVFFDFFINKLHIQQFYSSFVLSFLSTVLFSMFIQSVSKSLLK